MLDQIIPNLALARAADGGGEQGQRLESAGKRLLDQIKRILNCQALAPDRGLQFRFGKRPGCNRLRAGLPISGGTLLKFLPSSCLGS